MCVGEIWSGQVEGRWDVIGEALTTRGHTDLRSGFHLILFFSQIFFCMQCESVGGQSQEYFTMRIFVDCFVMFALFAG